MNNSEIADVLDKKIQDLVLILNQLGISTTGSCEGHIEYGSPAPWIKITPTEAGDNTAKKKMERILASFYKIHSPEKDTIFMIEDGKVGFWIHNGGADYAEWRDAVNERVKLHVAGEDISELIPSKEKEMRAKKIAVYQNEILLLTEFIKNSFKKNCLLLETET